MGEKMESGKDVGSERGDFRSLGMVDRRAASSRRAARMRAAEIGELAIGNATLSRQVAALEQSNARLGELAGVVSHDLSEGLATIALFVEGLESRLEDDLDPAVARDLCGIRAGLERMNSLISEELESARAGGSHGPVDAGISLEDAISNLGARIVRNDPEILTGPMPWVIGDHAELTRLFQNLLANALASRDPDRELRISVKAHRVGLRWCFEVDDTGVGISRLIAERALEATEPSADPGRGLGLFICRRIVESHGGTIRATRREGGGTRVSFDLLAGHEPRSRRGESARLTSA